MEQQDPTKGLIPSLRGIPRYATFHIEQVDENYFLMAHWTDSLGYHGIACIDRVNAKELPKSCLNGFF